METTKSLTFTPVDEMGLRLLQEWYDATPDPRICRETPEWLEYVRHTPGVWAWMVFDGELCVGSIALDTGPDGSGCFGITVNPELRSRGYCKRMVRAMLELPELAHIHTFIASAHRDNIASQRCLLSAAFQVQERTPQFEEYFPGENYGLYVYRRKASHLNAPG